MPNYTQKFKEKIMQEYDTDKSVSQISRENKIATSTIYKWLKNSHTPRKPIKYTKELKQKIMQEYNDDKTTKQIAEENNIPRSTIHDWIEVLPTKQPNQILKMKEITSHETKKYQSLVTTRLQETELYTREETQSISFDSMLDTSEQYSLLNNANLNIPNQTIDFINNIESCNKLSSYNNLSYQKPTNL